LAGRRGIAQYKEKQGKQGVYILLVADSRRDRTYTGRETETIVEFRIPCVDRTVATYYCEAEVSIYVGLPSAREARPDPQLSGASIKSEQNRRFESRRESEGHCQDGIIGREGRREIVRFITM